MKESIMQASRGCIFTIFGLLIALPLAALDVSSLKQGAPERRGKGWEQRSEFTAAVREGGRLLLRADQGTVNIRPVPDDHVTCIVTLHAYITDEDTAKGWFDHFQMTARSTEGGGVYLSSLSPAVARHGSSFRVRLDIGVPQHFYLDVETRGGDLNIDAPLTGDARLTTAAGDIRTNDITGLTRAETGSGSITLGNVGGDLIARTAGGPIHVGDVKGESTLETGGGEIDTGTVTGTLKAETAGGDVVVGGAAGQVIAQTAGGHIQIGHAAGTVLAQTAGGSIRLRGAHGRVVAETDGGSIDLLEVDGAVRASTPDGRILAEFNSKTFASSRLETSLGDVYVYLPNDLPVTIDAIIDTAAGRQIQSDFPLDIQGNKEELVPTTLRGFGNLNGGGAVLKIRTVAGNIEIRRIDNASLRELKQLEESNWNDGRTGRH